MVMRATLAELWVRVGTSVGLLGGRGYRQIMNDANWPIVGHDTTARVSMALSMLLSARVTRGSTLAGDQYTSGQAT